MAQPLQPGYFGNQDLLILPAIQYPYVSGRPCGWPVPYSPMLQHLVLIILPVCIQYWSCIVPVITPRSSHIPWWGLVQVLKIAHDWFTMSPPLQFNTCSVQLHTRTFRAQYKVYKYRIKPVWELCLQKHLRYMQTLYSSAYVPTTLEKNTSHRIPWYLDGPWD